MASKQEKGWYFVLDEPVRILIVDDDPLFREFASVHLATPAATVETAADGLEAWDKLTHEAFGLVLVDIDMPGLDGFGLVQRMRSHPKLCRLPAVMITGREDIASIDRAFECGATSFVAKPVNWRLLSHQLRYVLRMSRIEADIRAARDHAEKLADLKGAILATVKHEFRTPLASIIGFSQMMREGAYGPLPPKYQDFAGLIGGAGEHLLATLVEMVNYAELQSGSCELAEDEYGLRALLDEAVKAASSAAAKAGVAIAVEATDDALLLYCDRAQFVRMLRHLLQNAVVHGGKAVKLTAKRTVAGDLRLAIADKGPGISRDHLAACGEPFFRADMSLAKSKGGLGLGLPTACRIAELHGGKLDIATSSGEGTTVTVTVPATRVKRTNAAPAAA